MALFQTTDQREVMMKAPGEFKYTKTHEWVKVDGGKATIGITDFAQQELGDIVFVETPEPGEDIAAGSQMGTVESVKAVSDLNAPVSGSIVEVNETLQDHPELVNQEPYEGGWIMKVTLSNPAELDELMDAAAYQDYAAQEEQH
jgi:glycine cleavage system H protein